MTTDIIDRIAESQAKFDGRTLIAMPAGERERYRERARLAVEAMAGEINAKVKPLEWEAANEGFGHGRVHYGVGVFSHWYAVDRAGKGAWACVHHLKGKPVHLPIQKDLGAAKAAAQADYEARIMAAILPDAPKPAGATGKDLVDEIKACREEMERQLQRTKWFRERVGMLVKAARRVVEAYGKMEDGDGNPCPDIAALEASLEGEAP